jgi:hypothetical protein
MRLPMSKHHQAACRRNLGEVQGLGRKVFSCQYPQLQSNPRSIPTRTLLLVIILSQLTIAHISRRVSLFCACTFSEFSDLCTIHHSLLHAKVRSRDTTILPAAFISAERLRGSRYPIRTKSATVRLFDAISSTWFRCREWGSSAIYLRANAIWHCIAADGLFI